MTLNKKLFILGLVCVIAAGGIYAYAYWSEHKGATDVPHDSAMGKVAAASVEDGTYTVRLRSILTSSEDTVLTLAHVTYFEGEEANASARNEVACKDQPIEACVPTLTRGYYVRESGAPEFTAPMTATTKVILMDKENATADDLKNLNRDLEPAFDVVITDGNIVSITERTPLGTSKG